MKSPPIPLLALAEPVRTATAAVPVSRLSDFSELMHDAGLSVDLIRLCHDRLYAYERIARAQNSGHRRLRSAAVTLFLDYEHRPADEVLH